MRKASRVLYLIALISVLLVLAGLIFLAWVALRGYANPNWDVYVKISTAAKQYLADSGINYRIEGVSMALVAGIALGIEVVLYFIAIIFIMWGTRASKYTNSKAPHVWCLIIGIIATDPVLIVAAALGLPASGKEIEL